MVETLERLIQYGCTADSREKICRSRGGESCAFDGAMIVLQPIADTAHIVHGPIACCGNSWEGRGTLSSKGALHTKGFTTDMGEIDIIYGSEEKLGNAISSVFRAVSPKAIFVYSTCVSGLIGEDIESVCRKSEAIFGIPIIPVLAPGFVGPKNLGNRIAGEVLLNHVIGTGEPPVMTHYDINLIGEYNIAGDLWFVGPMLEKAGCRILSRITGDSTYEEITWAHRAKLNVVLCSRALINVPREMKKKYAIPYIEVSFFGKTEIAKALRSIADELMKSEPKSQKTELDSKFDLRTTVELLVRSEEKRLKERLKPYEHLRGKKAVLYSGGVKSWSFISALRDLGIEIAAVGTKKSTKEDELKMKDILGPEAPLVEDVTPKNLLALLRERNADILVAGGRNQYLAAKKGYPFIDVNQERHVAYAGYDGFVNFAEQLSLSVRFYEQNTGCKERAPEVPKTVKKHQPAATNLKSDVLIDPLKHSPTMGATIALQGIDRALPLLHGAQGCTFLGKVLITKHFREPIALVTDKLFVEEVVMGSEEKLAKTVSEFAAKSKPTLIGVLTSGLTAIKGDDVERALKSVQSGKTDTRIIHIQTPDYDGGLETGYVRAVEAVLRIANDSVFSGKNNLPHTESKRINILPGSHLTPADAAELREIAESFGLIPVILPDLAALDGSRQGFSPLAIGGATLDDIASMKYAVHTLAIGVSMEPAAKYLQRSFGIEYTMFDSITGLAWSDAFFEKFVQVSGKHIPAKYGRQRRILVDGMRDAYSYFGNKKICTALEPDLSAQTSKWLEEMGACIDLAVIPTLSDAADHIQAREVRIGGLHEVHGNLDALISNSHAESTAKQLGVPLYQMGFPVYKILGYTSKITIGYRGTLSLIQELGNLLMQKH